jgi:hypothetical protein
MSYGWQAADDMARAGGRDVVVAQCWMANNAMTACSFNVVARAVGNLTRACNGNLVLQVMGGSQCDESRWQRYCCLGSR